MIRTRLFRIVALLLVLLCMSSGVSAGGKRLSTTSEHLQALFVKRLVNYVSWPEGAGPAPDKPFVIAATDAAKLRPYFDDNSSSSRFTLVQWPVDDCHVLVVNGAPDREAAAIITRLERVPVLTIGQSGFSLRAGVVVNFKMSRGKIRLQVNPRAAGRAGLSISSKLLQIAEIYTGETRD